MSNFKTLKKMILWLIIFSNFLLLPNCAVQTEATEVDSLAGNNNPVSNTTTPPKVILPKTDNEKRSEELEKQNERFRKVPDEWRRVDFKNFKYDFGRLKNGELREREKTSGGGTSYSLEDVFYLDLTNGKKKEAIVFIWEVSCGASCDGGRQSIYFFQSLNSKPKVFGVLRTGSPSGGCFIKSLRVEKKKIYLEQFGKCKKNPSSYWEKYFCGKFCVSGLTNSVYSFENFKLIRESVEEKDSEKVGLMNFSSEISINE